MTRSITKSLFILPVALLLMGQGCALPFLTNQPDQTDGGLFRSTTHGQTWQQANKVVDGNETGSLRNTSIRSIVFDPVVQNRLFVGTAGQGIFRSENGGDSWEPTSLRSGDYSCIIFQPTDHEVMYSAAGSSVLKSITGGKTWTTVYSESAAGSSVTCVTIAANAPQTVWATTSGGKILRSLDAGKNWELMLTISAMTPRSMFFSADGKTLTIFSRSSGIFVISVEQKSWQNIGRTLAKFPGATTIRDVAILPPPSSIWMIATDYGLLRSTDEGATWESMQTLDKPGTVAIQNILVNPRDVTEYFITVGRKVQRSNDSGQTWTINSVTTTRTLVQLTMDPNSVDRLFLGTFLTQ